MGCLSDLRVCEDVGVLVSWILPAGILCFGVLYTGDIFRTTTALSAENAIFMEKKKKKVPESSDHVTGKTKSCDQEFYIM